MVAVSRPGANVSIRRPHRQARRRSWAAAWSWLALLLALFVFVVPPRMGALLRVENEPAPAEAAFVSHGLSVQRSALDSVLSGVLSGKAPYVLVGQQPVEDSSASIVPSQGELAKRYLVAGGVAGGAVQVVDAENDDAEARALAAAAAAHGWKRVVAYVPEVQSRRLAGTLMGYLTPSGVDLVVVAMPEPNVQLDRWWETRSGLAAVLAEYPRLLLSYVQRR